MRALRVVGPPGTGKTSFIRRQVELWAETYRPDDFVLTSFTKAAAAVLRGRVDIPARGVATLHALAYRAIGSPPVAETGQLAARWNDSCPAAWRIPLDTPIDDNVAVVDNEQPPTEFADYSLARSRLLADGHPLRERTREFGAAWEDFKRQTSSVDFADMIELALESSDTCPGEPRVLVVDEAQDLTPLQWALVARWSTAVDQLIVAGDPAQCIYEWAGATPEPLLEPLPDGQQRVLGQSYRLPQTVHRHSEAWLSRHSPPMMAGREYAPKEGHEGLVRSLPGVTYQMPDSLLRDIEMQVAQGRTCMVLATCSYMLRPLVASLRDGGLPFHNPYRRADGAWNPLGAAREGATSTVGRVLDFLRPDPQTWGDESRWWTALEASGWVDMLQAAQFGRRGAKTELLKRLGSTREDIVDLVLGALPADDSIKVIMHDTDWLAEHVASQFRRPVSYAAAIRRQHGGAALRQEPKIIVGTIHSVKGGEADVVYVFPDLSYRAWQAAMTSTEGRDAMIRLAYVAFTRVRQELVLLSPQMARLSMWS